MWKEIFAYLLEDDKTKKTTNAENTLSLEQQIAEINSIKPASSTQQQCLPETAEIPVEIESNEEKLIEKAETEEKTPTPPKPKKKKKWKPPVISPERLAKEERPGHLEHNLQLVLHTSAAQRLFYGKPRGSHSLLSFARDLRHLWQAMRDDDPYAHWTLMGIYSKICDHKELLNHSIKHYQKDHEKHLFFKLGIRQSLKPITVNLNFSVAYAYWGAQLLGLFDELNRYWLDAEFASSFRFLSPYSERCYWKRKLRSLFAFPGRKDIWYRTGITREDVRNDTPLYKALAEKWEPIPSAILENKVRTMMLPRVRTKQ